ncbi:CoA-binding protein [Salisediminibacterium beveridgei]|uniref:Succinyl-CoA synthetase, alpha subunit-like protein n=1 Tax=Salisediminibacterium beveridgei TaxID=632773 RepID=A0A1D7QVJ0_9BACI|nr:CoA-binding protein [Salisediminibacterium beveridgei]AOM83025.1 Succinyl-CoA synthetase, alpha subunit-like protein [Salisediminibacterium beveridgei]
MQNPKMDEIKTILEEAHTIAVVGLSDKPNRTSYQVAEFLVNAGYHVIPVNPRVDEVFGVHAVDSISEIKEKVDIINVFRRSDYLSELAHDVLDFHAPVFWSQLGVYDENVKDELENAGKTVIMDRCIKVDYATLLNV